MISKTKLGYCVNSSDNTFVFLSHLYRSKEKHANKQSGHSFWAPWILGGVEGVSSSSSCLTDYFDRHVLGHIMLFWFMYTAKRLPFFIRQFANLRHMLLWKKSKFIQQQTIRARARTRLTENFYSDIAVSFLDIKLRLLIYCFTRLI